jgi:hypothetical protein
MRTAEYVENSIASFDNLVKSIRDVNAQRRLSKDKLYTDVNSMHYGPGGAMDRVATMQYGTGGSADRIASMTYGPGGMYDRHFASGEKVAQMQQPLWSAEANLKNAQARGTNYNTDLTSWIAGLKDTEGNSLLGRQKGIEFNVLRSANPNLPGSSIASPTVSIAKPSRPDWYTGKPVTDLYNELDKENAKWKPFGEESPAMNWMSRRVRNIGEAPRRFLNEVAAPVANWSGWSR